MKKVTYVWRKEVICIVVRKWLYLDLSIPVQRFIYVDIRVIRPDLQKIHFLFWYNCQCKLIVQLDIFICSYLPPHNFLTDVFGPFDEDVCFFTSYKGRVVNCLIAWDGRILEMNAHNLHSSCAFKYNIQSCRVNADLQTCDSKWHYQNEDEPHSLSSHGVNQGWKSGKLWVQDEVQLTIHIVNVCILHILRQLKLTLIHAKNVFAAYYSHFLQFTESTYLVFKEINPIFLKQCHFRFLRFTYVTYRYWDLYLFLAFILYLL